MSSALIAVLAEARSRVAESTDDYLWSSWEGRDEALAELDRLIAGVKAGDVPRLAIQVVFAPTGPLQEVSMSAGWGDEFLRLASRADDALESS